MNDVEFIMRISEHPCDGCSAFEEIGGCGAWAKDCPVPDWIEELNIFLQTTGWDVDYLIGYIQFKDNEEINIDIELDEYYKERSQPEYEEGMWDEPILPGVN